MADPWAELAHVRLCTRPISATSDEHKQYLDKEISSLESVVARARQLRNLETPFVSLPEEVLLLIMFFHRDVTLHDAKQRPQIRWDKREYDQLWTNIAAVCRRLRSISRCPQLNSNVSDLILPPKLVERVLSRSASMPLTIALSDRASGLHRMSAGVLRYIKQNRSRVESLSLSGMHATDDLALHLIGRLKLFGNLKHLAIHRYRTTSFQRESSLKNFVIPVDITDHPLPDWRPPPALKSLHLTMTPFQWDCSIYDNLTELTLSCLHMYVNNISNLLQRTSRLEHIVFDRVSLEYGITLEPEDWEDEDESEEEVFDRLEKEFLEQETRDFRTPTSLKTWTAITGPASDPLLAFMRPSTSVSYVVKVPEPQYWEHELVAKHFPEPKDDPENGGDQSLSVVSVHFSIRPGEGAEKAAQATTNYFRHIDAETPSLTLQFTVNDKLYKLPGYILGQSADYYSEEDPDFAEVHNLSLESTATYTPDQWAAVLKLFPSLTTLELSEDVLANVLPAVEQVTAASEKLGWELDIRALRIRRSQKYKYVSSTFAVNLLLDWLGMRKERASPLRELCVPPALAAQMDELCGAEDSEDGCSEGWRSLIQKS